jgi:hypothetical protein
MNMYEFCDATAKAIGLNRFGAGRHELSDKYDQASQLRVYSIWLARLDYFDLKQSLTLILLDTDTGKKAACGIFDLDQQKTTHNTFLRVYPMVDISDWEDKLGQALQSTNLLPTRKFPLYDGLSGSCVIVTQTDFFHSILHLNSPDQHENMLHVWTSLWATSQYILLRYRDKELRKFLS